MYYQHLVKNNARDPSPKTVSKFIFFNLFAVFFNLIAAFFNLFVSLFNLSAAFLNLFVLLLNLSVAFFNLFVSLLNLFAAFLNLFALFFRLFGSLSGDSAAESLRYASAVCVFYSGGKFYVCLPPKVKRRPTIIFIKRWSVLGVTPTPTPKLNSHFDETFRSIAGTN